MKKWSVTDYIAIITLIFTLGFGYFQFKATQRKEEITLKLIESEYSRWWNAKYDFSIELPKNWIVEPQSQARDGFVCIHPSENIEIRAAAIHYDIDIHKEIFEEIDKNQFPDYDFEHEIKEFEKIENFELLLENRVKKFEQEIDKKSISNSDIPAKFIVYKYFNIEKKMTRVKSLLMMLGSPNGGEMDYQLVFVEASVDSSIEFYEANKDIFSRIVLSLNFGRKDL